jgi:predicted ArsR family transcriptional regulator
MEGITVVEIARRLEISSDAVRKRLNRLGVKPLRYIGSAAIYRENDIKVIQEHGTRGRPKAASETPPKPRQSKAKPKTAKPKKS